MNMSIKILTKVASLEISLTMMIESLSNCFAQLIALVFNNNLQLILWSNFLFVFKFSKSKKIIRFYRFQISANFFSSLSISWVIKNLVNFHGMKVFKTYPGTVLPPGVNFINMFTCSFFRERQKAACFWKWISSCFFVSKLCWLWYSQVAPSCAGCHLQVAISRVKKSFEKATHKFFDEIDP